jgi:hypothetical protein
MDAAPAAIPPKPNIAAINAMTKNMMTNRNIIFLFKINAFVYQPMLKNHARITPPISEIRTIYLLKLRLRAFIIIVTAPLLRICGSRTGRSVEYNLQQMGLITSNA